METTSATPEATSAVPAPSEPEAATPSTKAPVEPTGTTPAGSPTTTPAQQAADVEVSVSTGQQVIHTTNSEGVETDITIFVTQPVYITVTQTTPTEAAVETSLSTGQKVIHTTNSEGAETDITVFLTQPVYITVTRTTSTAPTAAATGVQEVQPAAEEDTAVMEANGASSYAPTLLLLLPALLLL